MPYSTADQAALLLLRTFFNSLTTSGLIHSKTVIIPKVAEIGREKNDKGSHSDLIIDCIKVFSSICPRTSPKIAGATGILFEIITYAAIPNPSMQVISKLSLLIAYAPTMQNPRIMGFKSLGGTFMILVDSLMAI